jgi:hypothetical protein
MRRRAMRSSSRVPARRGTPRVVRIGPWLGLLGCLLVGRPALADDKKVAAQELFDGATALTKQGDYPGACPKFAESERLDPQIGTLFWLADCQEHIHKLASAWANFIDAAERARSVQKMDHAKEAQGRADALKGRLNKLILVVSEETAAAPGLEIRRDDVVVGPAQFGVPVPVDTGKHVIKVSASSKRAWETTVESTGESNTFTVTIPMLKEEPEVRPVGTGAGSSGAVTGAPAAVPEGWGGMKIGGVVAVGAGAAALVVGGVLGGLTIAKNNDAGKFCRPEDPTRCSAEGVALGQDAKTFGTVSTAAFIAGGVLAAGGVVLFLTAPSGAGTPKAGTGPGPVRLSVRRVRVSGAGFSVDGAW